MNALSAIPTGRTRGVPTQARALAARLSALFERDVEIVRRLADAQHRLQTANDELWSGLAPDAFHLIYDGAAPAGCSQIAQLIQDAVSLDGPEPHAAWLRALKDAHWAIHGAFCEHQRACELRRQLAFDVGELAQQLTEVLCAAGWTTEDARRADVHQLAREPQQ
jgi:hypothetical protein